MGPPHTDWHLRKLLGCRGPGMRAGEHRVAFHARVWALRVALSQLHSVPPILLVLLCSDAWLGQPSFQSLPFLLILSLNYYILCIDIALPLVTSNGYLHSFISVYFIIVLISNISVLSLVTYLINSVLFFFISWDCNFGTRARPWNTLLHSCACFLYDAVLTVCSQGFRVAVGFFFCSRLSSTYRKIKSVLAQAHSSALDCVNSSLLPMWYFWKVLHPYLRLEGPTTYSYYWSIRWF